MPEVVFRTSEGRTPKSLRNAIDPDEIDTQSPDSDQIDPDLIDTAIPNLDNSAEKQPDAPDTRDDPPANTVRAAPVKVLEAKRGCAKSFLFILGLIGFLAAAIIITAIYFLFYFRPPETGTF